MVDTSLQHHMDAGTVDSVETLARWFPLSKRRTGGCDPVVPVTGKTPQIQTDNAGSVLTVGLGGPGVCPTRSHVLCGLGEDILLCSLG